MSNRIFQDQLNGVGSFQQHMIGGYFKPQGAGAVLLGPPSQYCSFWSVTRTGVGVFKVQVKKVFSSLQAVLVCLQIDPAGATQTLSVNASAVSSAGGQSNFSVSVFTFAGAASEIVQPGSPTLQGSFIHWRIVSADSPLAANKE